MQFSGNKAAYPVYLTVGNIPKATQWKPSKHACVLIAYLSVDKIDHSRMNDQEHRSRVQCLFHESMCIVLEPFIDAGTNGVEMSSSDGAVRWVHPILTCYVATTQSNALLLAWNMAPIPSARFLPKNLKSHFLQKNGGAVQSGSGCGESSGSWWASKQVVAWSK